MPGVDPSDSRCDFVLVDGLLVGVKPNAFICFGDRSPTARIFAFSASTACRTVMRSTPQISAIVSMRTGPSTVCKIRGPDRFV